MSKDWSFEEEDVIMTKVVILGNQGVGKTSMLTQYTTGQFPQGCAPTIGASFRSKVVHVNGYHVKLQMWDTAGQERFKSMTPMYYRSADAAILVFDIGDPASFRAVKSWVAELQEHAEVSDDVVLTLAGNKADTLAGNAQNHPLMLEAKAYADSINAQLFAVSAKTAMGLQETFLSLSKALLKLKLQKNEINPSRGGANSRVDIERLEGDDRHGKCPC